jgi:hypothetical protein
MEPSAGHDDLGAAVARRHDLVDLLIDHELATMLRPRLALRKQEAPLALGISDESFDHYVKPQARVVRWGSLRVYQGVTGGGVEAH